jgi:hypothetical protein
VNLSDPAGHRPTVTAPRGPLRGIPTSRAFWELRAEQMMNRIFDPEPAIDLEGDEAAAGDSLASRQGPVPTVSRSVPGPGKPHREGLRPPVLLLTALGGVCMVSTAGTLLYLNNWNQAQESLRQERNLLLVERLRSLGPANPTPIVAPDGVTSLQASPRLSNAAGARPQDDLPPPPEEPWIQQLDELPRAERSPAPVLRVPISPRLAAAAPPAALPASAAATRAAVPAGPAPVLVGVVGAPGRAGSAIFQMGGTSTSVGVGETIGGSGWRLQAADGDTAVIERGGEVRRISIGNGE